MLLGLGGGLTSYALLGGGGLPAAAHAEAAQEGGSKGNGLQQAPQEADKAYARPTHLKGLPTSITLWQYEVCPYCCKVKAVLDYYKLPYQVIEVNPLTKAELKWHPEYKKVPVIKMVASSGEEEVVVDSTWIVSRLAAEVEAAKAATHRGKPPAASKAQAAAAATALEKETRWRKWADERFVKVLTANIYRSFDESLNTFQYITEQTNWSWGTRELARLSGTLIMWQVGKRLPAKYKIEGDLREAMYTSCNEFVEAMSGTPFMGGSSPDLADLAVYGVLKAIEDTPTFKDAMSNSKIAPWFGRMAEAIGTSSRI